MTTPDQHQLAPGRTALSAPSSGMQMPHGASSKLPRLHWCAYRGDIQGTLQCITDGCSLHETVSLRNQHGRLVCGITALFLAAQRGHGEIVKLLVTNGASPIQPCFIQGSTELCTPAEVASLNLHFKLSSVSNAGGPPSLAGAVNSGVLARLSRGSASNVDLSAFDPDADGPTVDPARPDHTKVLQRFLKDLDLAHWQPEHDGPLELNTGGAAQAGSTRPASPGSRSRAGASPPRSVRSNISPARSRARSPPAGLAPAQC
eukprot:XP_001692543.1 predicted protein [Chlamydomonas reinhardtii]